MFLSALAHKLLAWARIKPRSDYLARLVSENPMQGQIRPGEMLVVGGPGYRKWAYFLCPCGCGVTTMLKLTPSKQGHWRVSIDAFKRPSIFPSVWRTERCRSHYWVANGTVVWVHEVPHFDRRR